MSVIKGLSSAFETVKGYLHRESATFREDLNMMRYGSRVRPTEREKLEARATWRFGLRKTGEKSPLDLSHLSDERLKEIANFKDMEMLPYVEPIAKYLIPAGGILCAVEYAGSNPLLALGMAGGAIGINRIFNAMINDETAPVRHELMGLKQEKAAEDNAPEII